MGWLRNKFKRAAKPAPATLPAQERAPLLASTMLDSKHMTMRQTLKAAWSLTKPYFTDPVEQRSAFLLLATMGVAMVGDVALMNWMNNLNGALWEGFTRGDAAILKSCAEKLLLLAMPLTCAVRAGKPLINDMLGMRWKRALNARLQDAWVSKGAYQGLQHEQDVKKQVMSAGGENKDEAEAGPGENPEQRLAQSVEGFVDRTVYQATGLTSAMAGMLWFTKVMWDLSGPIPVNIAGHHGNIPGMAAMAALAFIYSGGGMWAINKIGGNLTGGYEKQQKMDADYRLAVARMQENAEQIALMRGELAESKTMSERYSAVLKNSIALMKTNAGMDSFRAAFGQLSEVLPLIAQTPRLLAHAIDISALKRIGGAFSQIDQGVSWAVYSYGTMANYKAVLAPLANFANAVEDWNENPRAKNIVREEFKDAAAQSAVEITDLTISKPNGDRLIEPFCRVFGPGDRVAISGEIGSGKTTLFKTLMGQWNDGKGRICIRTPDKIMIVPQVPYMPLRNLRGVICYPKEPSAYSDEQVREALRAAELGKLESELDNDNITGPEWMRRLSGGQKQCVSFARAFLEKPEILMVDEITSGMDPETQSRLYAALTGRLPKSIIFSIAHNQAVTQYHNLSAHLRDRKLTFTPI